MTTYRIIGNGVSGTTAAEQIRKEDPSGKISLFTDEDLPFYYRIRLNEYIAGEVDEEALVAKKAQWYTDNGIELMVRTRVTGADPGRKEILTEDGASHSYDKLLLATGSHAFIPPIKGADKEGVFSLRTVQDARAVIKGAADLDRVVLIGGGLLGLEAGHALRKLGKEILVVEFFPRLLPRQLDVDGAKRLQAIMEGMGFTFRLGAKTDEIQGGDRVEGLRLEGGEGIAARMIIVSAGVRPNLDLAEPLGLACDKGIKVDARMRTNAPDIFAAGDVAEFEGIPYGIWPAAMEQGRVAGTTMAGGEASYGGTTMANSLKVVGIDLASAGEIDAEGALESQVLQDDKIYKKVVIKEGRVIGCIMLGDTSGFNKITKMIAEKEDITGFKDDLLLD